MIFLSDDAIKYMKKYYIKTCIVTFIGFACLYTISKQVNEQEEKIYNLTKKLEELSSKGD
jgi:hypothetical protein